MKIHIVQKGDTLWKIANKYGVDFEQLKSMNTQLSNPDLIMPGMKIKVPSGNIAIKKEAPVQMAGQKKEMPIADHPFAKEKPKESVVEEDIVAKEPETEKPSKPYIPPVPNVQHPVYSGLDVNNYYTVNMAMMPQMAKPQLPPKPENVFPDIKDVDEKENVSANEAPSNVSPEHQEEDSENMANMPNVPNVPNVPNMPNMPYMQSPAYTAPMMHQPQYLAPQQMVPVSPVLPGSGLCPPGYFPHVPMHHGYHPFPNQPYPTAVSPVFDEENAPNQPFSQAVSPVQYDPGFHANPYAGVPVSPVLPGSGLHQNPVWSGYDEVDEEDDDVQAYLPNQPHYPQAVAPAYAPQQDDCGCGGGYPTPYQAYPYQQAYPMPMPMQQPYGGYHVQQPVMAPQGYYPYGQQPYGQFAGQMAPSQQMFNMPTMDQRDGEEED